MPSAEVGAVQSPSVAGFVCEVVVPGARRRFRGCGSHDCAVGGRCIPAAAAVTDVVAFAAIFVEFNPRYADIDRSSCTVVAEFPASPLRGLSHAPSGS
jgi:hypothetical protein